MQIRCFVNPLGMPKGQRSLVDANVTGIGPSWHATKQKDAPGGEEEG